MIKGQAKILALGDIVGENGTEAIEKKLWNFRKENGIDMVIANGENACAGNGINPETAQRLFRAGIDVITGGNHTFRKSTIHSLLEKEANIIRPANYPSECPGFGYCIFDMCSYKVLVINLLGTVFMESLENPFICTDKILKSEEDNFDLAFVDFHAEATSEKLALGLFLDGRISGFFGTHTHVQTSDEKILPNGTGYITDLGMCGVENSVLGVKSDIIIRRFLTKMPQKHEEAEGEAGICGCVFTVSVGSGKCTGIERIRI